MSKREINRDVIDSGQPAFKASKYDPNGDGVSLEIDDDCEDVDLLPSSGLSGLIVDSSQDGKFACASEKQDDSYLDHDDVLLLPSSGCSGLLKSQASSSDEKVDFSQRLKSVLDRIENHAEAAELILQDRPLKEAIFKVLGQQIKSELKTSLKKSMLIAENHKDERDYLLRIDPLQLCNELKTGCNDAFQLITQGRL